MCNEYALLPIPLPHVSVLLSNHIYLAGLSPEYAWSICSSCVICNPPLRLDHDRVEQLRAQMREVEVAPGSDQGQSGDVRNDTLLPTLDQRTASYSYLLKMAFVSLCNLSSVVLYTLGRPVCSKVLSSLIMSATPLAARKMTGIPWPLKPARMY